MKPVFSIDKKEFANGIGKLQDAFELYGPVVRDGGTKFERLEKGETPDVNFLNTELSPKSAVFPPSEVMFSHTSDEKSESCNLMREVVKDYPQRVIVGIRPCDAASFLIAKRNFDTPEYKDPYWTRAYDATTVISLACAEPCATCFCTSAGCGPFDENGSDVVLADLGDRFLVKVLTQKGVTAANAAAWDIELDEDGVGEMEDAKEKAESKITSSIAFDGIKEKTVLELYEAPFWEDETFACINCGTCTFVCPTCWCFDVQDENAGIEGVRMRNWDSCMFPLFTLHGSGHNPRSKKYQRARQRFMHKLKYYQDRYDCGIQCVGCGRCIRLCPVNLDIRKICRLMNSDSC